jgi:hypothetical protein
VAEWLFVAQNFDAITADDAHFADPFTCGRPPVAFYRLTAERYSFLCDRFRRACKAHANGLLAADRAAEAGRRFGLIEDWAWRHLPPADLVRAQAEVLPAGWPATPWWYRVPFNERAGRGPRPAAPGPGDGTAHQHRSS